MPLLGVTKAITADPVDNGDGSFTLDFAVAVTNVGTVALSNVSLTDDLDATFGAGSTIVIDSITATAPGVPNTGFDGVIDTEMLSATNLDPGETTTVTFTVTVTPTGGPDFENTATAEGTSPAGTVVRDDSQDQAGEQLEITNASEADQLGAAFIFMNLSTPSGNPNVVGDPGVYSSWFDGVVPIPVDGAFAGGGAAWGNADRELRKGSTLFAEFEFSGRKQLELEDEIAELAESSGFSVTEGDRDIVLENDEVVATYTFDAEDDLLQVEANFKTSL